MAYPALQSMFDALNPWAKVPQGKNCHVNLRGKYADGTSADVSNVDICADKTVDLVN
jgi:hypothetical protein